MPVTTRRRSAAIAANANRSALKSSPTSTSTRRRDSQTPPPSIITKEPLRSKKTGKLIGQPRRKKSLPTEETHEIACRFGHRLYEGEAILSGKATISPRLKNLMDAGVEHQARFYERKLAQVSADLAATGEKELWKVHHVVDVALVMLRNINRA
jgi:hypothetical protein